MLGWAICGIADGAQKVKAVDIVVCKKSVKCEMTFKHLLRRDKNTFVYQSQECNKFILATTNDSILRDESNYILVLCMTSTSSFLS